VRDKKVMLKKKQEEVARKSSAGDEVKRRKAAAESRGGRTKSIIGAEELVSDIVREEGTVKSMMNALRSDPTSNFKKMRGSRIHVPQQEPAGRGRGAGGRGKGTAGNQGMSSEMQERLLIQSAGYLQNVDLEDL